MLLPAPGGESFQIRLVRLRGDRPCRTPAVRRRRNQAGRDGNLSRDLLLEVQHVAQFAFVGFAPFDAVGRHPTELRGDAYAGSSPHDCSRDDAVDRQLTADLGKPLRGLPVLHRRRSRDHIQALDLRQMHRQGVGDAVDEIVLGGVAREVFEREHEQRTDRCGASCISRDVNPPRR